MKRSAIKIVAILLLCIGCFYLGASSEEAKKKNPLTAKMVESAQKLFGLQFDKKERELMMDGLKDQLDNYANIRKVNLENSITPAIDFDPIPDGMEFETEKKSIQTELPASIKVSENLEELAFYPVTHLAELIRTRQITSEQLTRMYLDRLKKHGPALQCVITLTEDVALQQARAADEEIRAGKYRGLLHGIPYGLKDLVATKGIKTTWGSVPYKEQMIDMDATIVERLRDAGAVLVAKTTVGELAWGDVWYGGTTKNPWNLEEGSSGSSAGSAAATSAGLVGFSIGTETWGSIISPSTRCGVTGLRPTYGRISRHGIMALSWTMDKPGPICRMVEDCAVVFDAIYGPDGNDDTVYDYPFNYTPHINIKKLKIGYLKKDFEKEEEGEEKKNDMATLEKLRSMGIELIPVELPSYPVIDLSIILSAESAAAFDELTRSNKDDLMVRQIKDAWPNVFRMSRFIPAVEYIQANRIRNLLIQDMQKLMQKVDLYVSPSFQGDNLLLTNLTGHPCVVVPNGFNKKGSPTSISFVGQLFGEAELLAFAKKYQDATEFHKMHPKL